MVYDELVLPPRPITDFNTRYSGITAAAMHGVTTSLADVQAWLLSHASSETLLVGHALENDLKALLVLHSRVRSSDGFGCGYPPNRRVLTHPGSMP